MDLTTENCPICEAEKQYKSQNECSKYFNWANHFVKTNPKKKGWLTEILCGNSMGWQIWMGHDHMSLSHVHKIGYFGIIELQDILNNFIDEKEPLQSCLLPQVWKFLYDTQSLEDMLANDRKSIFIISRNPSFQNFCIHYKINDSLVYRLNDGLEIYKQYIEERVSKIAQFLSDITDLAKIVEEYVE